MLDSAPAKIAASTITLVALLVMGWGALRGFDAEPAMPNSDTFADEPTTTMRAAASGDPALLSVLQTINETLARQDAELGLLRQQVSELSAGQVMSLTGEGLLEQQESTAASPDDLAGEPAAEETAEANTTESRRRRRTFERLVAAGLAEFEAQELIEAVDELTMQRLQRRYDAARQGTADGSESNASLQALPSVRELVRDRYGEDAYDQYLYAAGRGNRLVVRDVLANSPAANIGLLPGDQVLSLGGQRIHSTNDLLTAATASGGGFIPIVIQRGESVFASDIPAGPLGVTATIDRVNPNPPET